jgi:transcriptional regulator with XRE-family HTH domain
VVPKPAPLPRVLRELAHCIRDARVRAKLTQEQVAAHAGIGYKRYQELERGKVNMTVRTLVRISGALGLDFWELVRRR